MTARDWGRFLLHVGYPRTGTTFFQFRVLPHVRANVVVAPVIDSLAAPGPFDPAACRREILAAGEHRGADVTVLSQEALIGRDPVRWGANWAGERIAERLARVFPGALILIVVRNQADQLVSNYLKNVAQKGEWRAFPEHLRHHGEKLLGRVRYDGLVARYRELFGPEAVRVLPYEWLREDGPGFVEQCLGFAGVTADLSAIDFRPVNDGLRKAPLVAVHRALNRLLVAPLDLLLEEGTIGRETHRTFTHLWFRAKWRGLGKVITKVFARGPREVEIDLSVLDPALGPIRESNRRLAEMTGLPLGDLGYPV